MVKNRGTPGPVQGLFFLLLLLSMVCFKRVSRRRSLIFYTEVEMMVLIFFFSHFRNVHNTVGKLAESRRFSVCRWCPVFCMLCKPQNVSYFTESILFCDRLDDKKMPKELLFYMFMRSTKARVDELEIQSL